MTLEAAGSLALGVLVGFLLRYFLRRFKTFTPKGFSTVLTTIAGGGAVRLVSGSVSAVYWYFIGLLAGFVIYSVLAYREGQACTVRPKDDDSDDPGGGPPPPASPSSGGGGKGGWGSVLRPPVGLLFLALLASCSRSPKTAFNGLSLPRLDGGGRVALDSCPTPRCLTVYVAPWCGYCRRSVGLIKALRARLKATGIESRVVVGRDSESAVRSYAAEFGPDALLDPEGLVPLPGGVPHFVASDPAGRALKRVSGVPPVFSPPFPEGLLDEMARNIGLRESAT